MIAKGSDQEETKTGRSQAGLTLAETLMVIAVGAVAIVSGTLLFMDVTRSTKVNDAFAGLMALRTNTQTLYGANPPPDGDVTQVVIDAGSAPGKLLSGDHMRHPWGGEVTVRARDPGFEAVFADLPEEPCVRVVAMAGQKRDEAGIQTIKIGAAAPQPLPVDLAVTTAQCAGGADVTFFYTR
jgi:hypothetical protein